MIKSIGIQLNKSIYVASPTKTASNQTQDTNTTTTLAAIPYYPLLSFKGSQSTQLLKDMKSNNAKISTLEELGQLSDSEKQSFIDEYCALTGFPNLKKVNQKIVNHAKNVTHTASKKSGLPVLWSGYHRNCSISKGLGLPGSDLDARGIIVDGDQSQINRFKGELWNNFNPLLVSIRLKNEFPDIFSVDQLHEWTKFIDKIARENGLDKKTKQYKNNLGETNDYKKALMFNIDIRKAVEKYPIEEFKKRAPSMVREIEQRSANESIDMIPIWITQSMSSCLESLRSGTTLINLENLTTDQKEKLERVKNSYLYKYGNICMQDANHGLKQKLIDRKIINQEWFDGLTLDEKVDFISRMIYESFNEDVQIECDEEYGESYDYMYYNGDGVDTARQNAFNACA